MGCKVRVAVFRNSSSMEIRIQRNVSTRAGCGFFELINSDNKTRVTYEHYNYCCMQLTFLANVASLCVTAVCAPVLVVEHESAIHSPARFVRFPIVVHHICVIMPREQASRVIVL